MAKKSMVEVALVVQDVPVGSINLWADNPRKNDAAVPKVARSLQEHGQRSPIVVWRKNMTVYKGNTTLKAAVSLGMSTIKAVLVDFPSEQAAVAYGIADNKTSEFSEWDTDILSRLMKANPEFITPENTGFSQKELKGLMLGDEKPEAQGRIDMGGELPTVGEYLVLLFDDRGEMEEFKELFGMGKAERALNFSDLRDQLK